jgi:hypothetical protein
MMAEHFIAVLKNEALDGPEDQKIANFWGDGYSDIHCFDISSIKPSGLMFTQK